MNENQDWLGTIIVFQPSLAVESLIHRSSCDITRKTERGHEADIVGSWHLADFALVEDMCWKVDL